MNIVNIVIFLLGLYLTFEGSRVVFSKKHFENLMKTTWKDTDKIMGRKQGFYYSKLRGIGMLIAGLLALIITSVIFLESI